MADQPTTRIMRMWKRSEEAVEVEVTFPVYSKQMHCDGFLSDNSTTYMRLDADLTLICVTVAETEEYPRKSATMSVEKRIDLLAGDMDYWLGHGIYSSSKADFDKAVKLASDLLRQIKGGKAS